MNLRKKVITLLLIGSSVCTSAQTKGKNDSTRYKKYYVSTSYLSFTNWIGVENIAMYELFVSYRPTSKDIIGIKAVTWHLYQPLGIPLWDPALLSETDEEWYSGRLRESGIGFRYQRFLWKGMFAALEVVPMHKKFIDENKKKVGTGFRLYTSYHLGYHFSFMKDRVFIEPQLHCNYWPIDSKGPQGFKVKEAKWNNYFLFEPNMYIGMKF
jgi:hypothetical protein